MPEASKAVTINKPVAEVFAYLADPANDPEWNDSIRALEVTGPLAVGTVVKQTVSGSFGDQETDYKFTAYEPNSRFAIETIVGQVQPKGEYTFTAVDAGTEVRVHYEWKVPLLLKAAGAIVRGEIEKSLAHLDKAAPVLEAK